MRIIKLIFSIMVILNISFLSVHAQESEGGTPLSFNNELESNLIQNIELPYFDNDKEFKKAEAIQKEECSTCKNKYVGIGINKAINIKESGFNQNFQDGNLWLTKINSETAFGMMFYFDRFKLPKGAKLFIFNEDKSMQLGAFTYRNNPKDESMKVPFGTQPIFGKKIIIEYYEPNNAEFEGEISIEKVIHLFSNLNSKSGPWGSSGPCNINVACPEGDGWDDEISSVALILAYNSSNNLEALCTGVLTNNTSEDGRPFFLSANHCIDGIGSRYDYSTWTFVFHHQASTCSGTGSNVSNGLNNSVYSSVKLASDLPGSPNSDYLLLELNTTLEKITEMEVCYSGWNIGEIEDLGPFTGIHHPSGDIKKISIENNSLISDTYFGYSNNPNGTHWRVDDWDKGITEGGSSGSPIYDKNKRIVGLLHGGHAECNGDVGNGYPDWYGKLSVSNNLGGLDFWLDPDNTSFKTIDTYCPIKDPDTGDTGEPGNGNPGGGETCVAEYKSMLQDGFKIDGVVNKVSEICQGSSIIISSVENEDLCSGTRTIWAQQDTRSEYWNCNDLNLLHPYSTSMGIYKCYATFYWLYISVTQCDANLNDIGPSYGAWMSMQNNSSTDMVPLGVTTGYGSTDGGTVGAINSFPLTDYLPSNNIVFLPGQYYKVKIATSIKNTWFENTQFMHIWEDNAHHNGMTHTEDVRGKDVTLENATVQQDIEVIGSNSVTILPNSLLSRGLYTIDSYMNCYNFKKGSSNGNSNGSSNNNTDDSSNHFDEFTESKEKASNSSEFSIYPNPNNGVFKIAFEDTDYKNFEIKITDLQGRLIKQISNLNTSVQEMTIPGGTKGVYLIQIIDKTTQEITFGKVIIQ